MPDDLEVIRLAQVWFGGDMGRGSLPFSGGAAEQPALLMDIFEALAPVISTLRGIAIERARARKNG